MHPAVAPQPVRAAGLLHALGPRQRRAGADGVPLQPHAPPHLRLRQGDDRARGSQPPGCHVTPRRRTRGADSHGPGARPLRWVVLALALVAALAALPGAAAATVTPEAATGQLGPPPPAGATPNQVIDAQANPQNAGQTLHNH